MTEKLELKDYPTQALREARTAMIDLEKRAGDQWVEHRGAGIVREGNHTDTQIDVVRPDGTIITTEVKATISISQGKDTLFIIDPGVMIQLFPKPARNGI